VHLDGLLADAEVACRLAVRPPFADEDGDLVFRGGSVGEIGGFDASGCGDVVCSPIFHAFTEQLDGFMTTPVIVNGRLYVAGHGVSSQPTMWVFRPAT
jgi:hypothetical protein